MIYTDKNKLIAEVNTQSDWNQEDHDESSFILNKPSLLQLGDTNITASPGDHNHDTTYSLIQHYHQTGDITGLYEYVVNIVNLGIEALIDGAPDNLNTLREISEALRNDPQIVGALINHINTKADLNHTHIVNHITDFPQSDWNQTNNTLKDFIKNKPDLSSLGDNGKLSRIAVYPEIVLTRKHNLTTAPTMLNDNLSYNCVLNNNGGWLQFCIDKSILFTIIRNSGNQPTDGNNMKFQYRVNKCTSGTSPCIVKLTSSSSESGGQSTQAYRSMYMDLTSYNINGIDPDNIPTMSPPNDGAAKAGNREIFFGVDQLLQFTRDSCSKGHELEFRIIKDYSNANARGYYIRLYYHTDMTRFIITGNIII